MANRCLIPLLPTLNASVDEKTHRFPPEVSFLSLQDTTIHFPFGDSSNLIRNPDRSGGIPAMATVVLEAGFPSHGASMISLAIGWAVVV